MPHFSINFESTKSMNKSFLHIMQCIMKFVVQNHCGQTFLRTVYYIWREKWPKMSIKSTKKLFIIIFLVQNIFVQNHFIWFHYFLFYFVPRKWDQNFFCILLESHTIFNSTISTHIIFQTVGQSSKLPYFVPFYQDSTLKLIININI